MSVPLPPPFKTAAGKVHWKDGLTDGGQASRRMDRVDVAGCSCRRDRTFSLRTSTPRLVLGLGPRTVVIIYFPRWWFSGKGAAGRGQMSCYREGSDCAADDKQCTAELLLLAPTMTPALHHLSLIQSDRGLLYNSIRGSVVWSALYCDRHGRLTDRCSPSSSVCVIDDAHHCVWTKQSYPFHRASVPVDCESIFYQAIYAGYHCIDKMPFLMSLFKRTWVSCLLLVFLVHLSRKTTFKDNWHTFSHSRCLSCHPATSVEVLNGTQKTNFNQGELLYLPVFWIRHRCLHLKRSFLRNVASSKLNLPINH